MSTGPGGDTRSRLLGRFRALARERVARMNAAFAALEEDRSDAASLDVLLREIHTLKGDAQMMGFVGIQEVAHATEDLLAWAGRRRFAFSGTAIDLVYQGFDLLGKHGAEGVSEDDLGEERAAFLGRIADLTGEAAEDDGPGDGPAEPGGEVTATLSREHPASAAPLGRGLGAFILAPGDVVQELTDRSGQLVTHQEATSRLMQSLWETLRKRPGGDSDELVEIARRLRERVFEARLRAGELHESVRRLRLLQVSTLFERYPAAIRDLARERGKRVAVAVEGGDVAVDKQVLDLIDEALLHIVRNAVDHGVETPQERVAAGKPDRGRVVLSARQHGSRVEITVRDDGHGIDAARVLAAAVSRGLVTEEEARGLGADEALRLLFRPGFSLREEVSTLSGRGVGLDVVAEQVRKLGGTIDLSTSPGAGAVFTMILPVSVALMRVLCFRCGRVVFGLPSANLDRVLRTVVAPTPSGSTWALELDGSYIPLLDLRRIFGGGPDPARSEEVDLAILEHGGTRLGLVADGFLGEREVVQRSPGAFLRGVRLLAGTCVLEEQQVALLLNVPELVKQYAESSEGLEGPPAA